MLFSLNTIRHSYVTAHVILFCYSKRYVPVFNHRPFNININTETVSKNFCFLYNRVSNYNEIECQNDSLFLLCGAGLVPKKFVDSFRINNSHPRSIPLVRGLDSLKWAIYEGKPIGVTTHLLGDEIDAGYVIECRQIEIEKYDTFYSIAEKVYHNEMKMIVDSIGMVDEPHELIHGRETFIGECQMK